MRIDKGLVLILCIQRFTRMQAILGTVNSGAHAAWHNTRMGENASNVGFLASRHARLILLLLLV